MIELGNNMTSFKKVVIAEGIIAFLFYALTGVAGYLTFGADTKGISTIAIVPSHSLQWYV